MADEEERIDELEAAARVSRDRIEALEVAKLNQEAAALVSDARIADLLQEVEHLQAAREHAAVIEQAKGVLMGELRIGADSAFAVLVAASMRENVKLFVIAQRIAAAQDHGMV
jgi:AmiR/NasT family two-component response regulator